MNPYVLSVVVALLAPLLATRSHPYVVVLPLVVTVPPLLSVLVRLYAELRSEFREVVGLEQVSLSAADLALPTLFTALAALTLQYIHRRLEDHSGAIRLGALQIGMATLWFGSGFESLSFVRGMGTYWYLSASLMIVAVLPEVLTHFLKPSDGTHPAKLRGEVDPT